MLAPGRPPTLRVAYAVGVRIHKTAQNSNSGVFFTPKKAAEDAWEITFMPPKLVHRDGIRAGEGGGEGGQNHPKLEFWRVFGTGYLYKSSRI